MSSRIKELEIEINKARNNYYNGQSTISDKAYDVLVDELFTLDPKNPAVIGIGCEPVSDWKKYKHLVPMGSLNKCQTQAEFVKWANDYILKGDKFFLTTKLDGLSISLIYEGGIFVKGATRGSGVTGELITVNAVKMIGVPLRLNRKINATIRGEVLMSKEHHQKYFSDYSNTRNAASGISRRYDGVGCDKLTVLSYNLISDDLSFTTQVQQFSELQSLGFIIPPFYLFKTSDEVKKLRDEYTSSLRDKFSFELDGLVIHNNDLEKIASFGETNGRPKGSIAYKFDSIAREANISDIIIQCGNSGRLTPVAVFSPKVSLMGAEVERASLHNFSNIANLGIDIGAKVLVCRSNDVIPFVEEVTQSTGTVFQPPTHCPACGQAIIETGEYIQCPNFNCKAQVIGRIKNWIKELNVLEFGDTLIEKIVEAKLATTVADLYTLSVADLAKLDRMGDKSAQKCYDNLWAAKDVPLEVFLGGLSIPMIGQSTIKAIMNYGCDTLKKFGQLDAAQFEKVPGVGPTKAKSLADGLADQQQVILDLIANGVKIKNIVVGKLTGKSFAITGTLSLKRVEVEKIIADNGGEMKNSVGKNLSYLIIADPQSTSSKAQAARKLGVILINESDLLLMIA